MEMLDGADIVREVEAAGARHEAAGAGPAAEEGASVDDGWEDWDMEDWVAGTGVNLVGAEAEAGAGAESEVEAAGAEPWWVVVDNSTAEGVGRAIELDVAL